VLLESPLLQIWSLMLMKFLQTQNSMLFPGLVVGLCCVISIGFNVALVGSLGFAGAPWATTVSRILQVSSTLI
jgi:MATE family multidrug resistance protein